MARGIPRWLVGRDLTILFATLLLWRLDAAWRDQAGVLPAAIGVGAGLAAVLCAFLVHEWGHLAGALLRGAVVHFPDRLTEVFLFKFDSDRNDRRQFLGMSYGGFAASALLLAFFLAALPRDATSGRIALVLAVIGIALTIAVEGPIAWRVAHGSPIPRGAAYRSSAGSSGAE